jgi:DNA-binding MarR family transcriptional regulator
MKQNDKDKLIEQIHRTMEIVGQSLGERESPSWINLDLTIGQLKSLLYIDLKGGTPLKDVANALNMAPPNATTTIDVLVKEGLVSREENCEDRRKLLLKTTEKGRILVANLKENAINRMSDLLTQLSLEELHDLARGLQPLLRASGTRQVKPVMDKDLERKTGVK